MRRCVLSKVYEIIFINEIKLTQIELLSFFDFKCVSKVEIVTQSISIDSILQLVMLNNMHGVWEPKYIEIYDYFLIKY